MSVGTGCTVTNPQGTTPPIPISSPLSPLQKEPVAFPTGEPATAVPYPISLLGTSRGDAVNIAVTADLTPSLTPQTLCVYIAHNSQDT